MGTVTHLRPVDEEPRRTPRKAGLDWSVMGMILGLAVFWSAVGAFVYWRFF